MKGATIKGKPLSVNKAWKGMRYKTGDYKAYEAITLAILPKDIEMPSGKLKLSLTIGFSNKLSDIDNPVKLFVDILQKKYDFNDRDIYHLTVKKEIVKKGMEFIAFEFNEL